MSNHISRREFLSASTVAAAAAVTGVSARSAKAADGANERLRFALIGCGARGSQDAQAILQAGGVELVAVCDVDKGHAGAAAKGLAKRSGGQPEVCGDYRKILDRKDIDFVTIATPDHWHAAIMMLACAAGKDVYVEKPIAHNIREGRAMVNAARKHKRIVQAGMQQRSDAHFREATEYLRKGSPLGVISRTATFNFANETPGGIGNPPDSEPPAEVDYDMWLGAAPKRLFNPNRFHWSWRWFYDYGAGMIGDWNVHIQDIIHWGMGVDAPLSIAAFGPTPARGPLRAAEGYKRVLKDNRETPDMMDVVYEYQAPDGHLFTQVYTMDKVYHRERDEQREGYGTEFHGSNGSLFINRGGWRVTPEDTEVELAIERRTRKVIKTPPRTAAIEKKGGDSTVPHAKNFLECVRSRKVENLNCDIEVGHRTAAACHLGNVALRVGRKIWWDREREIVLTQDGRPDEEANKLLTREYRKGFELPEV